MADRQLRDWARYLLAGVRLVNGTGALFFPKALSRRLGVDPAASPAAIYALRLFGIRTILIGAELLLRKGEQLDQALRTGLLIHASDAASAAIAGYKKQVPTRTAVMGTVISTVNVGLAFAAQRKP